MTERSENPERLFTRRDFSAFNGSHFIAAILMTYFMLCVGWPIRLRLRMAAAKMQPILLR